MDGLTIGEVAEQAKVHIETCVTMNGEGLWKSRRGMPRMTGCILKRRCDACGSLSVRRSWG
jgi:hypothetical protein